MSAIINYCVEQKWKKQGTHFSAWTNPWHSRINSARNRPRPTHQANLVNEEAYIEEKNRYETEFTLLRLCYFCNDTQIVAEQEYHSNGLFIGNVAIRERCVIWRPIWCLSPRPLQMLLPSAIGWIKGITFSESAVTLRCYCNSRHWHNSICTIITCLTSRKPNNET